MSLTIAEAARATGLSADALRYYERDGLLLAPIGRSSSGHRQYVESDIAWIVLLTRLRSTGMPIRDLRRYAEMVRAGEGNETQRLDLLQAHRERVIARLATVTEHLSAIDHKIDLYLEKVSTKPLAS